MLGPTQCFNDTQAALPWEGRGAVQQLQSGAAWGLFLRSKDGTEHGCCHDSMELGTTARAGRGTEASQGAVAAIHEYQKQGERNRRAQERGNSLSFFPGVLWAGEMAGHSTPRLLTLQLGDLSSEA